MSQHMTRESEMGPSAMSAMTGGSASASRLRVFGSLAALVFAGLLSVGVAWAVETYVASWVTAEIASRAVAAVQSSVITDSVLDAAAALAEDGSPASGATAIDEVATEIESRIGQLGERGSGFIALRIYARDGTLLYAEQPEQRGQKVVPSRAPRLAAALTGTINTRFLAPTAVDDAPREGRYSEVLDIYAPLVREQQRIGVIEIYSDLTPLYVARAVTWILIIGGAVLILLWYLRSRQAEQEMHVEALMRQAFCDPLTGLANRALFQDRLDEAFDRVAFRERRLAVLFLDLDRFKAVNDTLGHSAGDELLAIVADRLSRCVRPGDTVARLGGDEFTVLLEGVRGTDDATRLADRILAHLRTPISVGGHTVSVAASIGIALNSSAHGRPDDLLRDADVALYRAKEAGKDRYAVFDSSMDQPAVEQLDLERDLRSALARGELRLHFQPIVELTTRRVSEVEALLRWQHPTRGLISPAAFVPLAEETGLIVPIGRWVLEEACRQVQDWPVEDEGSDAVVVSVNLSARQLQEPALAADVQRILRQTNLPASRLKLEITESMAMQHVEGAAHMLRELKTLGVQIAMDDFGTGYSSLAYLDQFPLDSLKIDRSFVASLGHHGDKRAIIQAIIAMGRSLHLSITAEGIETYDQYQELLSQGCDMGQGFYFARPQPIETLVGTPGLSRAA
jgi:diguanylate cyclase (GGDEF)-like protein